MSSVSKNNYIRLLFAYNDWLCCPLSSFMRIQLSHSSTALLYPKKLLLNAPFSNNPLSR